MDHLESWLDFVRGERWTPPKRQPCLDCGKPCDGDIQQHNHDGTVEGWLCPECYALDEACADVVKVLFQPPAAFTNWCEDCGRDLPDEHEGDVCPRCRAMEAEELAATYYRDIGYVD